MNSSPNKPVDAGPWKLSLRARHRFSALLILGCIASIAFIAGQSVWNPRIPFLTPKGPGSWILFPLTPTLDMHITPNSITNFERDFIVKSKPEPVELHIRAFKEFQLWLNGKEISQLPIRNWKKTTTIDISDRLRIGKNSIRAHVECSLCNPALALFTTGLPENLQTDGSWFSFVDDPISPGYTAEATPTLASTADGYMRKPVVFPEPPGVVDSLISQAPLFLTSFVFFALLFFAIDRTRKKECQFPFLRKLSFSPKHVLWVAVIAWAILFLNNIPKLAVAIGFDVLAHSDYINLIRNRHTLPLAHESFSTYQPPLFYLLATFIYNMATHLASGQFLSKYMKIIPFLSGIGEIFLAYFASKIIFRERPRAQIACILFVALTPMNIYMSHFISNETLSAFLIGLSIVYTIHLMQGPLQSNRDFAILGLFLGLGMLTKLTCLMIIPLTLGILIWTSLVARKASIRNLTSRVVLACFLIFLVSGWYYIRNVMVYGKPFVANWEPLVKNILWWQDPSFHIRSHFFQFGGVFSKPYLLGFHSFFDGLYSTFWGDGFLAGHGNFDDPPPWNYEYMSAIYALAIPAVLLLLVGFVISAYKALIKLEGAWMLIFGVLWASLCALIFMNLKIPYYSMAKAFYTLHAIIPIGLIFALAFDRVDGFLEKGGRSLFRAVLYGWAGTLALSIALAFIILSPSS